MTLYHLSFMQEPLYLCNRSFRVSESEFIPRGSECFPYILSSRQACQLKVTCSDLASSPLYTAFPRLSEITRGSQALLLQ